MMRAGLLRHRITIEQVTETQSGFGGIVKTWATFAKKWASIMPLRSKEKFEAQQMFAQASHKVRLRYVSGVVPKMRITFGSRTFDIQDVLNLNERDTTLELIVTEDV